MNNFWRYLLICLLVFLTACEKVNVAEDLNQSEAHEVISVLNSVGITSSSSRGRGGNATYIVSVRQGDYLSAIEALTQQGLPKPREKAFSELVVPQGLMPNTREFESLRLDYALARELEEAISNISGVISAKAIVRYSFLRKMEEPQVSIILKTKPEAQISNDRIKKIVGSVFPGISPAQILTEISAAKKSQVSTMRVGLKNTETGLLAVPLVPFLFWNIPGDEHFQLAMTVLALLAICLLLGLLLGYYYAFFYNFGGRKSSSTNAKNSALRLDEYGLRNLPEK